MKHGTRHTYEDRGCRCQPCTTAKLEYNAARNIRSRRRLSTNRPPAPQDVDHIAVERAIMGDRNVPLNRSEMLAVFAWMDAHRHTARAIAEHLGVTNRTVQRWRAEARGNASEVAA